MGHRVRRHVAAVAMPGHADPRAVDIGLLLEPVDRVFDVLELLDAQVLVGRPRRDGPLAAGAARVHEEDDESLLSQRLVPHAASAPRIRDRGSVRAGVGLEPDRILLAGVEVGGQDQLGLEQETVLGRDLQRARAGRTAAA